MNNNTVYEWILQSTLPVSAHEKSLESARPYLSTLVRPGDEVLDLCCGTGFVSFWCEAKGANVTGMDVAPYMISLAKQEAIQRRSTVEFIEADIFVHDFGQECFDLISCFDSISDYPMSDFAKLGGKIAPALKPGGRFVVKYVDGFYKHIQQNSMREGVYQETPERITYRFREYLPEIGASVNIMSNETRGEEYDRKGYIYTPPIVQLAISAALKQEQHVILDVNQFLDVFVKAQRVRGKNRAR